MDPIEFVGRFVDLMNSGGWVMWVLFVFNFALWYGLGFRYVMLMRGTKANIRHLVNKRLRKIKEDKEDKEDKKEPRFMINQAIESAIEASIQAKAIGADMRKHIDGALFPLYVETKKYSTVVIVVVILAPLIGLLGTVDGMIETFDALQSSSMFAQGSSISGGISKALYTTELGLVVAVPGLILGRILDKQADRYELEFEQMTDIICTKEEL